MYGDNRSIIFAGGGLAVFLLLLSLSLFSLIKINRLEKRLASPQEVSINSEQSEMTGGDEKNPLGKSREQSFFDALDFLEVHTQSRNESKEQTEPLDQDQWIFLTKFNLLIEQVSQSNTWSIFEREGNQIYPILLVEKREADWLFTSLNGEIRHFNKLDKAEEFIEQESHKIREERVFLEQSESLLYSLSKNPVLLSLIRDKKSHLVIKRQDDKITRLEIVTLAEERPLLIMTYAHGTRLINGNPVVEIPGDKDSYINAVLEELKKADGRSSKEIAHEESLSLIQSMYSDKTFSLYLKERDLFPQWTVRSDEDFSYSDLVNKEGIVKAAFAVKKLSGVIYLTDENDVPLISLESLVAEKTPIPQEGVVALPQDLEQIDDIYNARGSYTVLMVGYHNSGTDTMILAHVNGDSKKISLISIPRDLWWQGQKINAYYFSSPRESFLKLMTEITGLKIDHYLSLDMYAFIDVVNAMGGVDLTLETSVLDPSYRIIREDGTEGTLYYPPGSYHLNGVEALRLARSRHGSSDFDRGALQQLILASMKKQLGDMSLKDADRFRQFLSIGLEHAETNMSLPFMVKNLLKCRDYTFESGHTLNDGNTLYNTYSNYYLLVKEEKAMAKDNEDFKWGQWILLPVNNDWNILKYRIREILEIKS